MGETRGETVIKEKLTDFVERVISGYTRHVFKEHFRKCENFHTYFLFSSTDILK